MAQRNEDQPKSLVLLPAAARQAREEILRGLKGVRTNREPPSKQSFKGRNPQRGVSDRESPVTAYVHSLGDYRTTQEVADLLKVSPQVIRKWAKDPQAPSPSFLAPFGRLKVHLYTPEDVEAFREFVNGRRLVLPNTGVRMPEPEALAKARKK